MASTRNINTPGNYCLEERQYKDFERHLLYINSSSGEAYGETKFAGDGAIQGQVPWNKLSHNPADIESFLFGIGTTNLVKPMISFTPELTSSHNSQNFFKKSPTYVPEPLVVEKHQRPGYLS